MGPCSGGIGPANLFVSDSWSATMLTHVERYAGGGSTGQLTGKKESIFALTPGVGAVDV
jgi:hypothetical protein